MSVTGSNQGNTHDKSPGAILRRCREYNNISLEEASQTTKIGISYIKSLEEDKISGFANLTYLKGFLRIYAVYLGLNADDMGRMYEKLYGVKEQNINVESTSADSSRPARRLVSLRKLVLPAVLLLLILITANIFKRQPAPTIRPPQPAAANSVALPASTVMVIRTSARIKAAPPEIEESKAENRMAVSDKPVQSIKSPDSGKGFILKIKVTQNGNLNVAIDGSGAHSYELTVGDVIEWKAEKSIALDLSNSGGVDVELNGKPFKQLGPLGKPAYVVLDADGIKP